MNIYLVRHADAESELRDPLRALSAKGREEIARVAVYVSELNMPVNEIVYSKKLRARQTAQVLFEALRPIKGMSEVDGLSPLDAPGIWAERLRDMPDGVILVGHLPHLARLASLLLCGDAEKINIALRTAGIICLTGDHSGLWSLQWMLTPDVVIGEKGTGYACDGL